MIGTPWSMTPDVDSDLTTALPAVVIIPSATDDVPAAVPSEAIPRQIYIRKRELEKHGYTKGCVRCDAIRACGSTTAQHSAACRKRIEEAMQADESEQVQARIKATVTRRNEYIEKRVAEDVAAQQAKKPRIDAGNPSGSVRGSAQSSSAPPRLTPGADDAKRRRLESQADPHPIQQPSNSSSQPMSTSAPAQPKRKLDVQDQSAMPVDDDTDMLSICNSIKESAEADVEELCETLRQMGMLSVKKNDVSEICSRLRVTAYATSLGLSPGFALDLAVVDPDDGMPWDFDVPSKCNKALEKVRAEKPKLLIGSPMCTAFGLLQNL